METIDLETAKLAVKAYNNAKYHCVKNTEWDKQAREMFVDGLGLTEGKIFRQVRFIGWEYGGVRAHAAAIDLAPSIAADIFGCRTDYEQAANSAAPLLTQVPSQDIIQAMYGPFVKQLPPDKNGRICSNWLVWAAKFWHFLNPDAFAIEDSRADTFFGITREPSVDKYLQFAKRFREFALSHQDWLPALRQVDKCVCPAWCDNKLWDKMYYGLEEPR